MQIADQIVGLVTHAPMPDVANLSRAARPHGQALADAHEELAETIEVYPRHDGESADMYRWRLNNLVTGDLFARIEKAGKALADVLATEREERERREHNEAERIRADKEADAACARLLATIERETKITPEQWAAAADVLHIHIAAVRARSTLGIGDPAGSANYWRQRSHLPPYRVPNFYEFGDDVLYKIHISNAGNSQSDLAFGFRFHTKFTTPDSFLYNTGPITSLNSAELEQQAVLHGDPLGPPAATG